ncbi:hypothetical protein S83_042983, partial [Arachis hypogaea]
FRRIIHLHSNVQMHQYRCCSSLSRIYTTMRCSSTAASLLCDRDKLCQLLEQHPKLMQMLQ